MQRNEGLPSITKEELLAHIVKTFSLNSAEQKYFQQVDAEIGSNTYNKFKELIVNFEQIISATEIKPTTASGSRA